MLAAIPIFRLAELANPFEQNPWGTQGPPLVANIRKAIESRRFEDKRVKPNCSEMKHAARIAFLVEHGWLDPIELDVGTSSQDIRWIVSEGNHRLAAAIYRNDAFIAAEIAGLARRAADWFGLDMEPPNLPYLPSVLAQMGYLDWKLLANGELVAIGKMAFNNGRLFAGISDTGYEDCWCYDSIEKACQSMWNWDSTKDKEPMGWKRHPLSGRRREKGDPSTEYIAR